MSRPNRPETAIVIGTLSYRITLSRETLIFNRRPVAFVIFHTRGEIVLTRGIDRKLRRLIVNHAIAIAREQVRGLLDEQCRNDPRELMKVRPLLQGPGTPDPNYLVVETPKSKSKFGFLLICPHCGAPYAGRRGLAKHLLRVHNDRAGVASLFGICDGLLKTFLQEQSDAA